jgi:hypothetical protein
MNSTRRISISTGALPILGTAVGAGLAIALYPVLKEVSFPLALWPVVCRVLHAYDVI